MWLQQSNLRRSQTQALPASLQLQVLRRRFQRRLCAGRLECSQALSRIPTLSPKKRFLGARLRLISQGPLRQKQSSPY